MKRYKIGMIIIMFLIVPTFTIVNAKLYPNLEGKKIMIDPGHGGIDPGATYKGINEDKINLQISKKVKELLTKEGAIVLLTREDDSDLSVPNAQQRKRSDLYQRSKLINNSESELYISIHLNAEPSGIWYGAQVFYDKINSDNKLLAKYIQKEFKTKLNSKRKESIISNGYLYKRVKVPGVLLEVGFLSNPNERYLLQKDSYQNKIANAIVSGINTYFTKNND